VSCPHTIDVEELVLDQACGASRRALEQHVASCDDCRAALAEFEEERALFARRAEAIELPAQVGRALEARARLDDACAPLGSIGARIAWSLGALLRLARAAVASWRVVHGVLGAAALAGAFACVMNRGAAAPPIDGTAADDSSTAPLARLALASREVAGFSIARIASFAPDEPVACVTTASALDVAPGAESLACAEPSAVCEASLASAVGRP
jgi:hypothetical protein